MRLIKNIYDHYFHGVLVFFKNPWSFFKKFYCLIENDKCISFDCICNNKTYLLIEDRRGLQKFDAAFLQKIHLITVSLTSILTMQSYSLVELYSLVALSQVMIYDRVNLLAELIALGKPSSW